MADKKFNTRETAHPKPNSKWNPIIGLKRIAIGAAGLRLTTLALPMIIVMMITVASPGFIGSVKADSRPLSFTISDEGHGLIASFAANVEYPAEVDVAPGSQATISYALSSATGSIQITIPLPHLGDYIGYPLSD